jgi:hypothetical protein
MEGRVRDELHRALWSTDKVGNIREVLELVRVRAN